MLVGFDSDEKVVFEESLDLHEYWDEEHPVIDEAAFRAKRGIRRLVGKLYGGAGNLLQQFESRYDASGSLQSSVAKHEDGTETRFPPKWLPTGSGPR